jgi:hypothetical protein
MKLYTFLSFISYYFVSFCINIKLKSNKQKWKHAILFSRCGFCEFTQIIDFDSDPNLLLQMKLKLQM